jgi:hypothetical protein
LAKYLALLLFGIIVLLSGLPLLRQNLYLGIAVIAVGAGLTYWSRTHLSGRVTQWAMQKGERVRQERAKRTIR